MNMETLRNFGGLVLELGRTVGHTVQQHPLIFGAALCFFVLVWSHFKGDYGPETWSLAPQRPKAFRGLVHVLVMPLRLLASIFSSAVALLLIALLAGFGYVVWRLWQG